MTSKLLDDAEWLRIGHLGLLESLCQCGADPDVVNEIMTPAADGRPEEVTLDLRDKFSTTNGEEILLASLGHNSVYGHYRLCSSDSHVIDHLCISTRSTRAQIDVGNKTIFLHNFTVGERELGALWVNLATNPNIKKLTVYAEMQQFGQAICVRFRRFVETLSPSTFLQSLNIYSHTMQEACPESGTVYERPMPVESLKRLMKSIASNKTSLESLGITAFPEDVPSVASMVSKTITLRGLCLNYVPTVVGDGDDIIEKLASAFRKNTSVGSFEFAATRRSLESSASTTEDFTCKLLAPLVHSSTGTNNRRNAPACNSTIKELFLPNLPRSAVKNVAAVLRTNKTLTTVGLRHSHLSSQEWIDGVFRPLQDNNTLEQLDLSHGSGLTEDTVFDELFNLIKVNNTTLKSILLAETELQSKVGAINEQLRVNKDYGTYLASEDKIQPQEGRVVLIGFPFAGKTRIRETWQDLHNKKGWFQSSASANTFLQGFPQVRQLLFGKGVHQELNKRTRGLEITLIGEDIVSVWDLAGQQEFHALHDYVFPNAENSCFVYVFSAIHPPGEGGLRPRAEKNDRDIRDECRYWLRLVSSNSKLQHRQSRRPSVTFVMTHVDALKGRQPTQFDPQKIVSDLRSEFGALLDISHDLKIIDASSQNDVKRLVQVLKSRLAAILSEPTEYQVCSTVRDRLREWRSTNESKPVLRLQDAERLCGDGRLRLKIQSLAKVSENKQAGNQEAFQKGLKVVLRYLNDVGEIIFVEGLNFIVVRVDWFGREVLGYLIDPFHEDARDQGIGMLGWILQRKEVEAPKLYHENGVVRRSKLDVFLKRSMKQSVLQDNLVDLMIHMQMCFHVPGAREEASEEASLSEDDPRLFFPALLAGGASGREHGVQSEALKWTLQLSSADEAGICYVGRRLECEDQSRTFLSPGFFPRLQVILLNYFREQKWLDTEHFVVSKNFIRFAHDGMEVIIEYSENIDFFVDVLVKSIKGFYWTSCFIRDHVNAKILEFCSSPQGCPGVNLVEGIIRPVCVERPFSCRERKDHSILVSDLKKRKTGYIHIWKDRLDGVHDSDSATDLLHGSSSARPYRGEPTAVASKMSSSEKLPLKFFFSVNEAEAWCKCTIPCAPMLRFGKRRRVKIQICCDGYETERDRVETHKVDGQPGRVLHLAVNSKDFYVPIAKVALLFLWEGTKIAAGVFNVGAPRQIDGFIDKLVRSREMDIDVSTLREISMDRGTSEEVSSEDILNCLEKYVAICRDAEWLKEFLAFQEHLEFLMDFQLRKVSYQDRNRVPSNSWVCEEHVKRLMEQQGM